MVKYIIVLIAIISFSCVPSHDWIVEATKKKVHDKEAITTWIMANTSTCNSYGNFHYLPLFLSGDLGENFHYYKHRVSEVIVGDDFVYSLEIVCHNAKDECITFVYLYDEESSAWCYFYTTNYNQIDNRPQNY